jgi:hypothetical protein
MAKAASSLSTTYRDLMRRDERGVKLLDEFAQLGETVPSIPIPSIAEMTKTLHLFDVPAEDIPEILAARSLIEENEELRWLLDRHVAILRHYLGQVTRNVYFLDIPLEHGAIARFFYLYVYAAMTPFTLEYFHNRNIPQDIIAATMSDVGSKVRVHHRNKGMSGLASPWWMALQFRGMIYQLGRLQFERALLGDRVGEAVAAAGLPYGPESHGLSVHIRDFMGPMSPEACDDSFNQARDFFPRYFPEEEPAKIAFCHSWLLDDQLPQHLKPSSNIVQFQQRFHLVHQGERDDASAAIFIWGKTEIPDQLPEQASSLERAIIGHHQAGGHWGWGIGWCKL